ncbi:MAG: DUF2791 family P-loop domain-containing protein, partial [Myxococcales bacterium]|nr:DUF2791 family P-loop domain-containing protein [Myxococcales bacterium]
EVETIQRMPAQTREKSLNALRQLVDMLHNDELPGLYLVVTGTPDFFDGYKGIKAEQALYQRVATSFKEGFDNYRAPQVRLRPFDAERLRTVGLRIRELFVASHPERVHERVGEAFVDRLVDHVTEGFGGRVEVTPRVFLRELVDVMDRVDLHEAYDPMADYALDVDEAALHPTELSARKGTSTEGDDDEDASAERPRRRLDG